MKTHIACATYSTYTTPPVMEALLQFCEIDYLLDDSDVEEIEITVRLPTKIIAPHLESLYSYFKEGTSGRPEFKFFKTTKKLNIVYTSKLDGGNYDGNTSIDGMGRNLGMTPNMEQSALAIKTLMQDYVRPTMAEEFALLFTELLELFTDSQALLKKKYSLDCQPLVDEMQDLKDKLPTDTESIWELVHDRQRARIANPVVATEPPRYHEKPLPKSFRVNQYEGGSFNIGITSSGNQFWAQVVAQFAPVSTTAEETWEERKTWYAVLHKFDKDGKHLSTVAERMGTTSEGESGVLERAKVRMDELVASLGPITYKFIKIQLFEAIIDGFIFGLVDTSTEEGGDQVTMQPNEFVFYPPWNGDYDT